jgi:hypothetical protein
VAFAGSLTINTSVVGQIVIPGITATADGTVDRAGNIALPQASISFGPVTTSFPIVGPTPVTIQPTADWTGTIDPSSGALTLSAPQTAHLALSGLGGVDTDCPVGPLALNLTTGTSGTATGTPYNSTTGTAEVVDNAFAIPPIPETLSTCTDASLINTALQPLPAGSSLVDLTATITPILKPVCALPPDHTGYSLVAADGTVTSFGGAPTCGSANGIHLLKPIVGMATTSGPGYWLAAADGGVFSFNLPFFGSMGGHHLNALVVGMAATPDGLGYWLVAADGGVFTFGDAGFFGSTGNLHLNAPAVGMAATPDGKGYWLTAADGGVFTFGDAGFFGSTGNLRLNAPVVGMAATPDGKGYWLTAADGGVFTFGDAGFHGSTGNLRLHKPVVGMSSSPDGQGYWLAASDGGVFTFGSAVFHGSLGGQTLTHPIAGIAHD